MLTIENLHAKIGDNEESSEASASSSRRARFKR